MTQSVAHRLVGRAVMPNSWHVLYTIDSISFSSIIGKWVGEYQQFGVRSDFVWKMFIKARREVECLSVPKKHKNSLTEVKFLITMFIVLLDDVADNKRNGKLLGELLKIVDKGPTIHTSTLNTQDRHYLMFTKKIWKRIKHLIKRYPGYYDLERIFHFDITQICNAIEYDSIVSVNRSMINTSESWLYQPHTLQFVPDNIVDLMTLSNYRIRELGTFREIGWYIQKMLRIGNWISTWEREIKEGDFSSGVFSYAIDSKIISLTDLAKKNESKLVNEIKKGNVEHQLLAEWDEYYWKVANLSDTTELVHTKKVVRGLENLLQLEIISTGHK